MAQSIYVTSAVSSWWH